MDLPTKGRVVLYKMPPVHEKDDGLRTALVCGRDKRGLSLAIFPDCACDSAQPPGLGTVMYARSVTYGDGNRQWRWPRDDDNIFEDPNVGEPDEEPAAEADEDPEESPEDGE